MTWWIVGAVAAVVLAGAAFFVLRARGAGASQKGKRHSGLTRPDAHELVSAAAKGEAEKVTTLLKQHAPVNGMDSDGRTALHFAVHRAHEPIVKLLLEHSANVNARDSKGFTPLHLACGVTRSYKTRERYQRVAKLLLDHQALVNSRSKQGMTPLYWAAKCGRFDIIDLLLEYKANVNAADNDGYSPLFWAQKGEFPEIADKLLAKGAKEQG